MNKLAILDRQIPIKSIPESELNTIIITTFLTWICDLLSLTDEVSAKRIEIALPSIKNHCWSMGFSEIKKMFELYADGNLSVKPIPNYFDRILLGKIVSSYKEQKGTIKKEINHDEILKETNRNHFIKFFIQYFDRKEINDCYVPFVYNSLNEHGFIKLSPKEKRKLMKDSEVLCILEQKERGNIKDKLKEFKNEDILNEDLIVASKKLAVRSFLKEISMNEYLFNEFANKYNLKTK